MAEFSELEFHPDFEDHQAAAGRRVVTESEAEEAWYGVRAFVPNRRTRSGAPYLMIGATAGGRRITVVLLRTRRRGVWRAYTAWDT